MAGLCECEVLVVVVVMLGLYEWFCALILLVAVAGFTNAGPSVRVEKRKGRKKKKD